MDLHHAKLMLPVAIACAIATLDTASAPPPRTISITISAMAYGPLETTVKVGDTVEWLNQDVVDHTATEKNASLWNVTIAPGKSSKAVMKRPGTFDYYCRYHPNMKATLVVERTAK